MKKLFYYTMRTIEGLIYALEWLFKALGSVLRVLMVIVVFYLLALLIGAYALPVIAICLVLLVFIGLSRG